MDYITDLEQIKEEQEQGREDVVYLPIGLKYNGVVIRKLTIKEPDGYTEETQTSDRFRQHMSSVITGTIADIIQEIEGIDLPTKPEKALDMKVSIAENMAEPDRQYIMMRMYRLEHGNNLKTQVTCRECSHTNKVEVDLTKDFNIKYVNEDTVDKGNDDRMLIKDVELTHPITFNGKQFDKVNVRVPNGATALALEKAKNLGQVVTKMILQMVACNVDKFIPNENEIKRWSKKVRHKLIEDVGERQIGFSNSVEFTCEDCGCQTKGSVQVTDFLGS